MPDPLYYFWSIKELNKMTLILGFLSLLEPLRLNSMKIKTYRVISGRRKFVGNWNSKGQENRHTELE